jgi:hypothetical protein
LKNTSGKSPLEETPVFFLDRTFGRHQVAQMLRDAGFVLRTTFDEYGEADSKIADPVIIASCGLLNRVLLTGDQDLVHTWNKEIIQAEIAVFVTTDNNEGPKQWAPRIIAAKEGMLRELRRRKRPFTANISKDGRITQVRVYDGRKWQTVTIKKKNLSNYERKRQR